LVLGRLGQAAIWGMPMLCLLAGRSHWMSIQNSRVKQMVLTVTTILFAINTLVTFHMLANGTGTMTTLVMLVSGMVVFSIVLLIFTRDV
jgi:hypothetical protein